jgi:hypothetical protein
LQKFAAGPRDRRRLRESAASGLAARSKAAFTERIGGATITADSDR